MKIKEINITANVAWSPSHLQPIYLACGTPSQQIDTSCKSSSELKIYNLDVGNNSLDMTVMASVIVPAKYHKLIWSKSPNKDESNSHGVIAGGCDNGSIYIYSPYKMLQKEEPLILSMEGKHSGPVFSMDFNNHQTNLLAAGSKECEIFIWDINNTAAPLMPGDKANASADVTGLQWNKQVEHIMASTYGGRCVVHDLRKSTSIIQIAESVSGIKAHNIQWHPDVATQLMLSCEDDVAPICQVWDLRFAASPLKQLVGHQRGIMATSWCSADPDLFITSSKDNKIYVWNPNTTKAETEIVGEFPSYNQWCFDIGWCPRDPSLVAASSVDGTVSVYSIIGAGLPPVQSSKFSAIADSFPGMEIPTDVPPTAEPQSIYLKYPPKWFHKKAGVSFGFGGRMLSWNSSSREVQISQIVTEPLLVQRSQELEEALSHADFITYSNNKSENSNAAHEKVLWDFIGATFKPSSRSEYMSLFKFHPDQVATVVRPEDFVVTPEELADKIADLGASDGSSLDPSEQFEMIASSQSIDKTPEVMDPDFESISPEPLCLSTGEDPEGLIRHALLLGDFESAVKVCLKQKKNSLALIIASHAGTELYYKTRDKILKAEAQCGLAPLVSSIVCQDLYSLVSTCKLSDWKEALVAVLTYASDEEGSPLAECLAERLEQNGSSENLQSAVLCYICAGNLEKFVSCYVRTKPAPDSNPSDLQDLVEIIVLMERALASTGKNQKLGEESIAGFYLCQYAYLLSSQGALATAVSYLNNSAQGKMIDLRERLYRSLGYQTSQSVASARNRSSSSSSQTSFRRSSTPFSPTQPPPSAPSFPKSFGHQSFNAPNNAATVPTFRPVGSSFPNDANSTGFSQPPLVPGKVQTFNPMPPVPQPALQTFVPQPPVAQSYGPPPVGPPSQPMNAGFRRGVASNRYVADLNAPNSTNQPSMFTPSAANTTPSAPPNINSWTPTSSNEALLADSNPRTPAAFNPSVPRGWNDPPPISAARKAKQHQKPQNLTSSKPAPVAMNPGVMVPQSQEFQGFHPMGQSAQMVQTNPQELKTEVPPAQAIQKGPLPVEHQNIQLTFDALRVKGFQVTSNPSAKQRFQDIAIKLETLYDKLRAGQVSEKTTSGLHQIVGAIRAADYHGALRHHSATISSGNFSEMSHFMPAIKMLLTTCMQCQVYL